MKNLFTNIPILKTNKYYSTQELSQLFKANESTIKRWADSGKLKCFKTPGGHRKYTTEHISEFITNYQYEIIAEDINVAQKDEGALLDDLIRAGNYKALSEVVFNEALHARKENIFSLLKICHYANVPLVVIYDEVMFPAVGRLLSLKDSGKISKAEEQITRNCLVETLFQFRLLSQKVFFTDKAVISCSATGSIQEIGLTCAEHLLEVAGWKVYSLGVNSSLELITESAVKNNASMLCLSIELLREQERTQGYINTLKQFSSERGVQMIFADFYADHTARFDKYFEDFSLIRFSSLKDMLTMIFEK